MGIGGWEKEKKVLDMEGGASPNICPSYPPNSVIIPEKLDSFINKFAEYTHEKWAFDKVGARVLPSPPQQAPFLPAFLKTPASPRPRSSLRPQVSLRPPTLPETQNLPRSLQPLQELLQESPRLLSTPPPAPTLSSIVALPLPLPSPPPDPEQLVLWGEHR